MLVIGAGRVGQGLALLDAELGLIDRSTGWEQLDAPAGEPVLVATRNDDLGEVIARVPQHRRADLVFTQNGMLRDFLDAQGLAEATRGLLFFAVAKRGDRPQPGGASPFFGPHAPAVCERLGAMGLPAQVLGPQAFGAVELEKLMWNCAFGLCCEAFDCSVGEVVKLHSDSLRALSAELHAVGQVAMGLQVEFEPLYERLCAYSLSIADYRGAVKEWPWRNGWFVERAAAQGINTPTHTRLLVGVGR